MRRVLIAGCGYVGCALAQRLVSAGYGVWGLRRNPDALPTGVEPWPADLSDPHLALPSPLHAVFYTAAASASDAPSYRAAYVDNLRRVVERVPPGVPLFFTSSTSAYGETGGAWSHETSTLEPPGFRGRIMREGEAMVRAAGGTVVRLGGIYGPGRTRIIESVRRGEARREPGPPRYTNRIHQQDAAGILQFLWELPAAKRPPLVNGVDQEPAPYNDVITWLAGELGVPAPPWGEARGGPAETKRVSSELLRSLGYRHLYPTYREGYGALLARA